MSRKEQPIPLNVWRISTRTYWVIITILICIRILMYAGMVAGYPETFAHKGWYLHQGGDQIEYITFAQHLARFELVDSPRTIGYPLFLVPFMWIFGTEGLYDTLVPVTIFQAGILFPLSIVLVARIAARMTGNRYIAVITATLWTLFPYLLKLSADIGISIITHDQELLQARFIQTQCWMVHQIWAQVASDPVSCFFVILSIYILLISLESPEKKFVFLVGIVSAATFLVRHQEAMLAVVGFILYLFLKRFRDCVIFCGSYGIVLIPQVLYNIYVKGYVLFGYSSTFRNYIQTGVDQVQAEESFRLVQLENGSVPNLFSVKYVWTNLHIITQKIPFSPIVFVLFAGMIAVAFLYIYNVKKVYGIFFILWVVSYVLFVMSYAFFCGSIPRYLMSITPMFLLAIGIHIAMFFRFLRQKSQ